METCNSCGSNYDSSNINILSPIPDGMCAECGTVLSQEKIDKLYEKIAPRI